MIYCTPTTLSNEGLGLCMFHATVNMTTMFQLYRGRQLLLVDEAKSTPKKTTQTTKVTDKFCSDNFVSSTSRHIRDAQSQL